MEKKWQYKSTVLPQTLREWEKILLENRDIKSDKERVDFFAQQNPLTMSLAEVQLDEKEVKKALTRLKTAVEKKQKVVIFGDYDADGNTATAIVWRSLKMLGLATQPFIPHRAEHGYGMNERSFAGLMKTIDYVPELIISVDNGIVAHETIAKFVEQGTEVIVTDHHMPDVDKKTGATIYPTCTAVVHSTKICGAAVAWFLMRELLTGATNLDQEKVKQELTSLLGLAGLATVTDQVPATGVCRQLIKSGLKALGAEKNSGMAELMKQARLNPQKITEYDLGFALGPRINAVGRMTNTLDGVRLLCTRNATKCTELANTLCQLNQDRQELTKEMIELAKAELDVANLPKIIVVAHERFHEGIIGLIAGKLTDEYYRPAIAVATSDGIMKGSARSIPGVNITEVLREAREHLLEVGGHEMAAGFATTPEKFPQFVQKIKELSEELINEEDLQPQLTLDNQIKIETMADPNCYDLIGGFKPHGVGNEQISVSVRAKIVREQRLGAEGQHRKVWITDESCASMMPVLIWNYESRGVDLKVGEEVQLAVRVDKDDFGNKRGVQLIYIDSKSAEIE